MELNWLGGHSNIDVVEAYIGPTSGVVAIGVSAADGFVPILAFEDLDSAVKFAARLNDLLEDHIKHTNGESQMENAEIPEVFKKAFDTDDSVSGRKH